MGLHLVGVSLCYSQWFQYWDQNGSGFACPDLFIVRPDSLVLFEAKLTYTPNAESQMRELYAPILEAQFRKPIVSCVVFRNATPEVSRLPGPLVRNLADLLEWGPEADSTDTFYWHLGAR